MRIFLLQTGDFDPVGWLERSDTHQLPFLILTGFAQSSTHPLLYWRPSMNSSSIPECSLDGAITRSIRAHEHLKDLIGRIEVFRREQENAISWAWDSDPQHLGEPKLVVDRHLQIPAVFGVVIGEICYNLRSALDYLIYELAILDSGSIVNGTQFPIEDTQKGFTWRQRGGWLDGLNTAHVAAIEALQPYNGCCWTRRLRDLSNPDKHRHLVFHEGSFTISLFARADRLRFLDIPGRVTSAKHPVSGKEVQVQINTAIQILFEDGTPVVQTLHEIKEAVTQALDAFQSDFT